MLKKCASKYCVMELVVKMFGNKACGGRALRIVVGITALVLLMAGGAGAHSDINISLQSDINNSFIMHRLDAGIPSHRDFGMPFGNQTGELTSRGLSAEYRYGRIPENRSLTPVTNIEKAAGMISASAGWFINDLNSFDFPPTSKKSTSVASLIYYHVGGNAPIRKSHFRYQWSV